MQSPDPIVNPTLRYAIIGGAAGIAPSHIRALQQLPGAQIVGLSDINAEGGAARAAELDCAFFVDHRAMLAELKPDVAVICAPHPFHPPLALDAFAAGAHVLVEKPIAVSVGEADTMIEAADRAGRLLVVSFQQRFRPAVEHIRGLIDAGEIGTLVRVLCVEPWYRPAAYYRSASWRGTWQGEGGGVLMNQAPHTLDLLCALVGLPHKVWGWTRTIAHAIEVEDTAQAMLEYSNGAPGYLSINTVEHGLKQRIEIIGDRAALEWVGDQLTIHRFKESLSDFRANSTSMYAAPEIVSEQITLPPGDGGGHLAVYRDLQDAIATGRTPRTDGRSALMALELANAITLSSHTDRAVTLPIDRAAYGALLADLRQGDQ
ncbi:MAG: Gfo/Idh/MocA family oxidoreductase, partial [Roseiflexaceae bacterium]